MRVKPLLRFFVMSLVSGMAYGADDAGISGSEGQTGVVAKEGFVTVPDGKLFYKESGVGVPIVVLHGGPGLDHSYLLPQMWALTEHGRVILYDQRGSGQSIPFTLDAETINEAAFVEDLEAIRQHLKLEHFIVVGHSWGGQLAMEYALKYSDRLLGMVLMDSGPITYGAFEVFAKEVDRRAKAAKIDLTLFNDAGVFEPMDAAAINEKYREVCELYCYKPEDANKITLNFPADGARSGLKVLALMNERVNKSYDKRRELLTVPTNTLILHGRNDPIFMRAAEEISWFVTNSNLVMIDNCGHFPYIEQPEICFDEMIQFIESVRPKPTEKKEVHGVCELN